MTFQIGNTINLGRKKTEEHKRKISLSLKGGNSTSFKKGYEMSEGTKRKKSLAQMDDKNPNWRGDKIGYGHLHVWVRRKLGKPNLCEHCRKTTGKFEWANKSGKYLRKLTDWIRLCPSCHRKYDKK